ncbi:hypothetical protein LTR37_009337 [Vermiconidia calcicola]|uniref:Uncharacterized protein n=1 Tax=Vermiconidia calcicola TaxID=1690605 RepID=A0ACC3N898_9PEZI|nr:hypothetical protein LTR37_009337 [Vermiconidia calcicola]
MAEPPMYSSQGSEYEKHQIFNDQENIESSPPNACSRNVPTLSSQKPKKPPTVTPKRFTKFFTPRNSLSTRGGRQSKAGRQLRDITKNAANRRRHSRPLQEPNFLAVDENELSGRPLKRRKHSIDIASSPPRSSPLKHVQAADQVNILEDVPTSPMLSDEDTLTDLLEDLNPFPQPITRLRQSSCSRRILQRSFGGHDALTRGWRGNDHCNDWRAQTANFVSAPHDVHTFTGSALPFCSASCNTNSLIAIGEEEGSVRLIDSSPTSDFMTPHITFRPHHNAIMDINFSSDDYMLATASGDQTARIIDMHAQQTVCILSGHTSSVKQVRFQPNDDNMITTSSRDGTVQIWDMRCGGRGSIASLRTAFARNVDNGDLEPSVQYSKHRLPIASFHRSATSSNVAPASSTAEGGVSITSIQHLPNGREHLLLTSGEVNSSLKLWDLRNAGRRGVAVPISSTLVPQSHNRTRHYGINSMAWSTDGARLYTMCRDGTVYAYSTNHLILGHAPEMSSSSGKGRTAKSTKAGVGPLYGFRHDSLRMGSFYIKASIRPARGDKSEMLAVGSSDSCSVLFPTNERHLPRREHPTATHGEDEEDDLGLPTLPPPSGQVKKDPTSAGIPIYRHGTALVRGHDKEVTSLTWTHDGELVTVSDDFTARCWREDGGKARGLRGCGEGRGQRWRCGWADVAASWDEEEG